MSEQELTFNEYIQRLDVICSVVERALKPGGRATKDDLRILHAAANRVINSYLKEIENAKSAG